jgi:hypothetical protein
MTPPDSVPQTQNQRYLGGRFGSAGGDALSRLFHDQLMGFCTLKVNKQIMHVVFIYQKREEKRP